MILAIKEHLKALLIEKSVVKKVALDLQTFKGMKERERFPLALITSGPGRFDNRKAKEIKYQDENGLWRKYVRGERKVPMILTVFAKDEAQSYKVLDDFLAYVPRDVELNSCRVHMTIEREEHTDKMTSVSDGFMSIVEIMCDWASEQEAVAVATFNEIALS